MRTFNQVRYLLSHLSDLFYLKSVSFKYQKYLINIPRDVVRTSSYGQTNGRTYRQTDAGNDNTSPAYGENIVELLLRLITKDQSNCKNS